MSADSESRRSDSGASKSPELIQWNSVRSSGCASGAAISKNARTPTMKDAIITPQAIDPETVFERRRPRLALITNPRNGSSGIRNSMNVVRGLPLQRRKAVGVERFPVAVQRNNDRQADGRLGRCDRHHEEHDDLPFRRPEGAAEGHERQVDG